MTNVPLPAGDPLFQNAFRVVRTLREAGFEAWIVGGAVRDLVLGAIPHEYDIATSALPASVQALFRRTVPVGAQFGVVRVLIGDFEFEVATFREDGGYSDGRRPDSVRFARVREDVLRRDFTMNGMLLDPGTGEVVDLVGGLADIAERRIRAIGDPSVRFEEDRLRPLRAVRFAARTGFAIDEATFQAIRTSASEVVRVSRERLLDELTKLLGTPRPGLGFRLLDGAGILAAVLPDLSHAAAGKPVDSVLDRLAGRGEDLLWAAFLWPLGPDCADATLKDLRASNRQRRAVAGAIAVGWAAADLPFDDIAAEKRLLRREVAGAGIEVAGAYAEALGTRIAGIDHARARLSAWTPADMFPERLVDGTDAVAAGLAGRAIAAALESVEDAQLRGDVTTRDSALAFLAKGDSPL